MLPLMRENNPICEYTTEIYLVRGLLVGCANPFAGPGGLQHSSLSQPLIWASLQFINSSALSLCRFLISVSTESNVLLMVSVHTFTLSPFALEMAALSGSNKCLCIDPNKSMLGGSLPCTSSSVLQEPSSCCSMPFAASTNIKAFSTLPM